MGDETAMTLRTGERATVRLPGLGTVGYAWTGRTEGDAGVVAVSVTTASPDEIAGAAPGVSVDELAVLDARRPGRARVVLEQRRSWETRPEPHARRTIEVTVT